MLPNTIFRQISLRRVGFFTDLISGSNPVTPSANVMNCLNRYAAATGFIRISFLDINQYRNWDVATLVLYAKRRKHFIHLNTLKGCNIIQNVIDKKRESFIQRKNFIVEDIREARFKVQEKMEEVMEKENIITIPNILTMTRLVMSPYIGYIIMDSQYSLALSLLTLAAISDLVDGQIARRWPDQASKIGSFLDPAADKVLIGSLVITMSYCNLIPSWLAAVVLFRDIFLMTAGFVIRYISLPSPRTFSSYFDATHVTAQLEPTLISKINTFVQLATVGISLGAPIWHYTDHYALQGLWYLTLTTTVAAAVSYILKKKTFKIFKNRKNYDKT